MTLIPNYTATGRVAIQVHVTRDLNALVSSMTLIVRTDVVVTGNVAIPLMSCYEYIVMVSLSRCTTVARV